jgi:hypothetical protein
MPKCCAGPARGQHCFAARAVLHVQAAGDPPAPADLAAWFTERAFHFYATGLRLPARVPIGTRPRARYLTTAYADLDAARARMAAADGITSVIVTAQGRAAIAAALWRSMRPAGTADALVLHEPAVPPGAPLSLDIRCPVLVVSRAGDDPSPGQACAPRRPRAAGGRLELSGHVTWLRLGGTPGGQGQRFFDELGRWLGAYMYGNGRDRLL